MVVLPEAPGSSGHATPATMVGPGVTAGRLVVEATDLRLVDELGDEEVVDDAEEPADVVVDPQAAKPAPARRSAMGIKYRRRAMLTSQYEPNVL